MRRVEGTAGKGTDEVHWHDLEARNTPQENKIKKVNFLVAMQPKVWYTVLR